MSEFNSNPVPVNKNIPVGCGSRKAQYETLKKCSTEESFLKSTFDDSKPSSEISPLQSRNARILRKSRIAEIIQEDSVSRDDAKAEHSVVQCIIESSSQESLTEAGDVFPSLSERSPLGPEDGCRSSPIHSPSCVSQSLNSLVGSSNIRGNNILVHLPKFKRRMSDDRSERTFQKIERSSSIDGKHLIEQPSNRKSSQFESLSLND